MGARAGVSALGRAQAARDTERRELGRAFSILANSHSLLHSGQLERVRSHLEMQSRWKTWPQAPQAMERPSSEALVGLAWYSMDGSCSELRQMAHVSVQMDQLHTATAFHFFT